MQELRERVQLFCEHPFFEEHPALVVAILSLEQKVGIQLPDSFEITFMPEYTFGERRIHLGKVDQFYFFGMDFEDGHWEYEAFKNKNTMKLFFAQMDDEIGQSERAFWLNEIESIDFH